MSLVLVDDQNNVVAYPYSVNRLKQDNPYVSFPKNITEEVLNSFNAYSVARDGSVDSIDRKLYDVVETLPIYENGAWKQNFNITEKNLDDVKTTYIELVNKEREVRRNAAKFVPSANAWFDCDERSLINIQGVFNMATLSLSSNTPFSIQYTDANNNVLTLDANETINIAVSVFTLMDGVYNQARTVKDNILAANTANTVLANYNGYIGN